MRVLVTGASGMLGRDLVAHLAPRHEVSAVDLEVDVTDASALGRAARECGAEAIFHLAAFTDVDGAEAREDEAHAVNAEGAGNAAAAAAAVDAVLVLVSTDYVFDGAKGASYAEDDVPAPLNAYGRTKLAGERAALARHPDGTRIARTSWLYGAGGPNFVDTMRRLGAERDEVSVVDDQEGCPTWTRDLAPALEQLTMHPPGVYHTAGGGSVTWAGLAEAVFAEAGLGCRVRPISSAELGRSAPRPARASLAATRFGAPRLRPWREALRGYLNGAG